MPGRNSRYLLTPAARADLEEIWLYTAATWSPEQAVRYTDQVMDCFEEIAEDPGRGRDIGLSRCDIRFGPGCFRCRRPG